MEDTRVWVPYCDVRYGLRVGTVKLHTCVAKWGILQRLRGIPSIFSPGSGGGGKNGDRCSHLPPSLGVATRGKRKDKDKVAFWTIDARWPYGTVGDKAKGVT